MLANINPDDFSVSNAERVDAQLLVRFFYKEVQDQTKTQEEGRPIFVEKEYVEIRVPGQRDAQACRPATHADKQRFHRHYAAFKERLEAPTEGTPLSEWPLITRSTAEELAFLHVKTVEHLAGLGDTQLGKIMGGYGLKEKAIKWLEYAGAERIEEDKRMLMERINGLEKQIEDLLGAAPKMATASVEEPVAVSEAPLDSSVLSSAPLDDDEEEVVSTSDEMPATKSEVKRPRRKRA